MSKRLTIDQIPAKYHGEIFKQLGGTATFNIAREPYSSESEQALFHESLGSAERKTYYTGKVFVRITSFRTRLLDQDNLCAKYFLDACRYSKLIPDDNPEAIDYEIIQYKIKGKENEETHIELKPVY